MKKKLLDRRGAAIELAIMMMVFSIFITTIVLTTALLQNSHKAKAELGIKQDILLEQLGEDFVNAITNGTPITEDFWSKYEGITVPDETIHMHDWKYSDPVAETCTEAGYTLRTCTFCNKTEKVNKVSALGHMISNPSVTKPACTTTGKAVGNCSRCGQENAVNLIAAIGHKWEKTEEKPATCTVEGEITYFCTNENCGEGYHETIPTLTEHTWSEKDKTQNGCEITTIYGCSQVGCEAVEVTFITYNHTEGEITQTREPSCVEDGLGTYKCTVCKEQQEKVLPATGIHSYENGVCVCGKTEPAIVMKPGYSLTIVAAGKNAYKLYVMNAEEISIPDVSDICDAVVLRITLEWVYEEQAYTITEWSKK